MSTSVDVVSILRDAEEVLRRDHYKAIPDDLHTARAAVAELIEAIDAERDVGIRKHLALAAARKRTNAALVRVKGA